MGLSLRKKAKVARVLLKVFLKPWLNSIQGLIQYLIKMKTIAILNDLFFAAKIRTTADHLGRELLIIKDKDELIKEIEKGDVNKIIADLNFNKFDVVEFIKDINTEDIYTIGFLSHIQTGLRKKAETVFDLVLA